MEDKRINRYIYVFLILIFLILIQLFKLQILEGAFWEEKSSRTSIQIREIEPARGNIYDCNGEQLAWNRPGYTVMVNPNFLKMYPGLAPKLSMYLNITPQNIFDRIDTLSNYSQKLARDVDLEIVSVLEEHRDDLPGVQIIAEPVRVYGLGRYAAHSVGYLGEISKEELTDKDSTVYSSGDLIGKMGVERNYDEYLRGKPGHEYVEVDRSGRLIRPFQAQSPILPQRGADVYLSLDSRLQKQLYNVLWYPACCGIVMNVKTGQILAMVSKPDFPPDSLSFVLRRELWESILNNPKHPLLNRCIGSNYPPASTVKPMTAIIALELGVLDTGPPLEPCEGSIDLGDGHPHRCTGVHGSLNLSEAISMSCDVFFYQLGLRIGFNNFIYWAQKFGFGKKTGIDLFPESGGLLPDSLWYDQHFGEGNWPKGVVVNLVIGQGEFLATPLQIIRMIASIANGGYLIQPRLVDSIISENDELVYRANVVRERIDISDSSFQYVKNAMIHSVQDGTSSEAAIAGLIFAGKTGTAENPGEDHSWFVAFAPADDPEIVVGVFIEQAGASGGKIAAPITKLVLEYYFSFISPNQEYIQYREQRSFSPENINQPSTQIVNVSSEDSIGQQDPKVEADSSKDSLIIISPEQDSVNSGHFPIQITPEFDEDIQTDSGF
ncbi:MAG: hypothetical protein APR63_03860 [Desulfuromonas sp. SDB]|nr:MAG: hypothetical protein APR63_03860 [Desulfuromonas sp. SDB]